ncbi:MAG: hypothetical protein K1X31_12505, partial [Gemmatimonadaceae bacterium]|nr:hypothetical protein [Gemmatimonadaceae bacterium]
FGVNYAAPFAYDFRAIRAVGGDVKRTIDADVAHLARLGVDAYRIHVWDKEVSDRDGNLLANTQLDHFDYLLAQLAARGIKAILTPIAWWGPGYPELDPPFPGFAGDHPKVRMAVDTVLRAAQARYLAQFVAHVNPYTGRSYRDDPDILAFEIFNEPWHDLSPPQETTRYINTLVAAMRGTGLRKPIFYNISEHFTPEHGRAVCAADIQGITAQWYPTGLVRGATLPGNPLPNVDRYTVPWADYPDCRNKARMVYEFDGADVAEPVMYPAMARAFRAAGFQWATQFAYDPVAIAHTNTEYQTHYLNLVYTPAKAISFLIAGEAFRSLARGQAVGPYPASARFADVEVSHERRTSELVRDTVFAYAGSTATRPPAPERLRHVAGAGASATVGYTGSGAYFLDRLGDGLWRLEVMPDAVPVEDPFSKGNLRRTVTRTYARAQRMTIDLPDLGSAFVAERLDQPAGEQRALPRAIAGDRAPVGAQPGSGRAEVVGATLTVLPGTYLLRREGVTRPPDPTLAEHLPRGVRLAEHHAPAPTPPDAPRVVRHEAPSSVTVGQDAGLAFDVVQPTPPDSVLLFIREHGWSGYGTPLRLAPTGAYTYGTTLGVRGEGTHVLEYVLTVFDGGRAITYPGAVEGSPAAWDFSGQTPWRTHLEAAGSAITLFEPDRDAALIVAPGYIPGAATVSTLVASGTPERSAWQVGVAHFGPSAQHAAFRAMFSPATRARLAFAAADTGLALVVRLRAETGRLHAVQFAIVQSDGTAWGTTLEASNGPTNEFTIPLAGLTRVPLVLIPRPYPTFLPYDLMASSAAAAPDVRAFEGLQFGFARAPRTPDDAPMRIVVESVRLVRGGTR